MVADTETPVSAMLKLTEPGRGDFLLESVEGGASRGRYSLIGLDPDLVFRAYGRSAAVNRRWQTSPDAFEACAEDSLAELRKLEIGRAHVLTPVTNTHLVCRLLL